MAPNARPEVPGVLWRTGAGPPAPGLGGENECYRDITGGRDYQKIGGAWGLIIQPTLPTNKLTGTINLATQVSGSLPAASVSGLPAWTYGTAFPGSPTDGDKHTLVDSTSNPSWSHTFRYNSGSSSSFKWESTGGTCISVVGIAGSSTSTSGTTLTGTLVTPRAGDYDVEIGGLIDDDNNWQNAAAQLWDMTAGSFAGFQVGKSEASAEVQGEAVNVHAYTKFAGVSSGHSYQLKLFDSNNVSAVGISAAYIKFTPRRCS